MFIFPVSPIYNRFSLLSQESLFFCKPPEVTFSIPPVDPRSLSSKVNVTFSGTSDAPHAGNIIQGISLIAEMTYDENPNPTLRWELRLPNANVTSAWTFRPVGFVVYQKPAVGSPRIVDVVHGVVNYSTWVQKPTTTCKMEFLLASLVQG